MASLATRAARLPAAVTLSKAWATMPPPLCGTKDEPAAPVVKLLPSEPQAAGEGGSAQQLSALQLRDADKIKSFRMHIGASLHIPTRNAKERPQPSQPAPARAGAQGSGVDPFEGLPFRGFAERLGESVLPALQAAREAEQQAKRASKQSAEEAEVVMPTVPHLLPFTRWAANSQQFRSTFIAEPAKERKKVRLSWYHPDDVMVPRDWFRGGLLEDIKYYMPFGLGGGSKA